MCFDLSARIFFIGSALLFNLHSVALSQTPSPDSKPAASSISGRVTIGATPAVKKRVMVREIKMNHGNSGPYLQGDESRSGKAFIAVTDADGRYRVTGLTAGDYLVGVVISGSYAPATQSNQKSKQVRVEEEEEMANVDFALVRGGVITGRVTYPDGKPIIGGIVNVFRVYENGLWFIPGGYRETDDRGVYRIYGLPAGRYSVNASAPGKSAAKYPTTYHPDVTDEKQAAVIEVKEGSEVGAIDIRLNNKKKEGYDVAGRVIDSETGEPVSQATIHCYGVGPIRDRFQMGVADSQGSFRLTGFSPGQYVLTVRPGFLSTDQQQFYSDKTTIDVTQGDVTGVEVRAKRGGAISGVVVFDEGGYPALKDRMSQTIITGDSPSKDGGGLIKRFFGGQSVKVESDGSFRLEGLPPGLVSLDTRRSVGARPPLLLRVERDGVAIPNSIEVGSGETITGIRLVLTDKTGTIRGQVNFTGSGLPEGVRLVASVRQDKDSSSPWHNDTVVVDKKGRFVIQGLMDGEYLVILNKEPEDGSGDSFAGSQRVQVARGAETQVTFTLNLDEERRKNER
jgi:Carboxypeptidase regulatory-like domain